MTTIISTLRGEGYHCWPDAPVPYEFLGSRHRHIFHIRVERTVNEPGREVEFIHLGRKVREWIDKHYDDDDGWWEFAGMSCEHIAIALLGGEHGFDLSAVEVWEDGENGARVEL